MARSRELEEKILQLYDTGLSMAAVGREVGRSAATVLAVLKKYNVETRTNGGIKKLPAQDIITSYQEDGKTMTDIAKEYSVTVNTIKKILLDNNISIRSGNSALNPFFKEDFFETIDTEAKAYFLGLLITDGCVLEPDPSNNHPNYKICLELQEDDKYILDALKEQLGLTSATPWKQERVRDNSISTTYSLSWYSTKMANDLAKYGVVPRKTDITYLPQIDSNLMSHLIRGMIDGDGSLTFTHPKGDPRFVVYFCGSPKCVTQVRDYLVSKLGVFNISIVNRSPHLSQISWAGKDDCLKICEYLYKNATLFLTRKFEKYQYALTL